MVRRLLLAVALLAAAWVGAATAQTTPAPATPAPATPAPAAAAPAPAAPMTPPARVRGKIASFAGHTLTVNSRDGQKLEITLKDPVTVATVTKVALTAIKPNDFIGTATKTGKDGKLTALEVLVFPEAMRGTGEGFYPWDLQPGSMMTNGTVKGVVKASSGRELTVTFKDKASGAEKTNAVDVPPKTPIVTFAPATAADLKPGAPVFLIAKKDADGKLTAARVTVGTHGVAPPM